MMQFAESANLIESKPNKVASAWQLQFNVSRATCVKRLDLFSTSLTHLFRSDSYPKPGLAKCMTLVDPPKMHDRLYLSLP